jgi:5-formyltetrahydrofolate cyclo-ligase
MDKASLRILFQQKRKELSEENAELHSKQIAEKLLTFLADKPLKFIHVFLPISGNKEVDTWHLIRRLQEERPRIQIVLPRIIPGTRELEHFIFDEKTKLITNRRGIPEPDPLLALKITPQELDVVLIPLLSFDTRGYRVGYGGGYYDRFLAQCKLDVLKIGLSYFEQGPAIEDIDEYDVPLDYSVTPFHFYQFLC